jgi:hypothetical protein
VRAVAGTFVGPRSESRRCGAWRKLAGLPNINDPMFDEPREHPGFNCLRARVSRQAGSDRLGLSTNGEPDIVIRPDSGTLNACERLAAGGGLRAIFRMQDAIDYYDGEVPPAKE